MIDGRTKAVFCESVGNQLDNVTDIAALAQKYMGGKASGIISFCVKSVVDAMAKDSLFQDALQLPRC